MTFKPTQDPIFPDSDEPSWFGDEKPSWLREDKPSWLEDDASLFGDQKPAPKPSTQAEASGEGLDGLRSELADAVRQFQASAQRTCDAVESLRQRSEQQDAATAERLRRLDESLARIEGLAAKPQDEEKAPEAGLGDKLDAVKASMDALTARNVDIMRQTMEFTNSSARRWTKELEEYRSLFRDSVFDDIWKDLGEIYINILKHLNRKNDPNLTREVEYCALEPILELLESNGVKLLTSEPGQKRSFKRTKSRSQRPTGDPEKDACVAQSLLPGFARESICLIPEMVESYVYQEGYADEAKPDAAADEGIDDPGAAANEEPAPQAQAEEPRGEGVF